MGKSSKVGYKVGEVASAMQKKVEQVADTKDSKLVSLFSSQVRLLIIISMSISVNHKSELFVVFVLLLMGIIQLSIFKSLHSGLGIYLSAI